MDEWEDATMFSYLDMRDKTAVLTKRMKYFTNNGKQTLHFGLYQLIYFLYKQNKIYQSKLNSLHLHVENLHLRVFSLTNKENGLLY